MSHPLPPRIVVAPLHLTKVGVLDCSVGTTTPARARSIRTILTLAKIISVPVSCGPIVTGPRSAR